MDNLPSRNSVFKGLLLSVAPPFVLFIPLAILIFFMIPGTTNYRAAIPLFGLAGLFILFSAIKILGNLLTTDIAVIDGFFAYRWIGTSFRWKKVPIKDVLAFSFVGYGTYIIPAGVTAVSYDLIMYGKDKRKLIGFHGLKSIPEALSLLEKAGAVRLDLGIDYGSDVNRKNESYVDFMNKKIKEKLDNLDITAKR